MEPSSTRDLFRVGPIHWVAGRSQRRSGCIDVGDESRVRLHCRTKVVIDTDMQLAVGTTHTRHPKPTAPSYGQQRRLRDLLPAQGS